MRPERTSKVRRSKVPSESIHNPQSKAWRTCLEESILVISDLVKALRAADASEMDSKPPRSNTRTREYSFFNL